MFVTLNAYWCILYTARMLNKKMMMVILGTILFTKGKYKNFSTIYNDHY
jgi:hypothetical protein